MKLSKSDRQLTESLLRESPEDLFAHTRFYFWAKKYWITQKGFKLDFNNYTYLREIYGDKHPDITMEKAAQLGFSEMALALSFFATDKLNANVGYFLPASSQMGDFVQMRVDPVIEQSNYLSRITARGGLNDRQKSADKMSLKRVRNSFIAFRGAQSPRQMISMPLDLVILDEYDRFGAFSIPMIEKRMNQSKLRWIRNISTPTIEGYGIDLEMPKTTCKEWWVDCTLCHKAQTLNYWENIDTEQYVMVCKHCHQPLLQSSILSGRWIAKYPKAERQGYQVTGLLNPRLYDPGRIKQLVENMSQTNEFKLQEAYNQDLGIPYVSTDRILTDNILNACQREYSLPFNLAALLHGTFAGLDIGKPNYLIIGHRDHITQKPKIIGVFTVHDVEAELPRYMKNFNIRMLVMDAMPEIHLANKMVNTFPGRVFMAYYNYHDIVKGEYAKWNDDTDGSAVQIHRTASMDEMYSLLYASEIELPKNAQYIPGLYDHLKNPKRVQQEIRGRLVYVYNENGRPDHYAHALNYMLIAMRNMPSSLKQITNSKEHKSIIKSSYQSYDNELSDVSIPFSSQIL